jgi:hypothetical protein
MASKFLVYLTFNNCKKMGIKMSIWKDGELVSNSYERTLVAARDRVFDSTIVWVEGSKFEIPKNFSECFGMCGGSMNTNSGISFTKEELLYIASNMKEGSKMKVAGCNSLSIEAVKKEFKESNNMVKTGPNQFSPKKKKRWF